MFVMPHGLTVDQDDNVWLTDVGLHQVFKFSPDGRLLLKLGEAGTPGADASHFNRPTDVAVLKDGSFVVSDGYKNTRVAKFLTRFGRFGNYDGQFRIAHDIAVGADGAVYVVDALGQRIQKFVPR